MIKVRFTGRTVLDGITYQADDLVCLDDGRASMCIDAGWAVDAETGRSVEPCLETVTIDVHDVRMGQCSN